MTDIGQHVMTAESVVVLVESRHWSEF